MRVNRTLWATILAAKLALAQQASTTAVCNSAFSWMQNSRNQSPCLIVAYLQGACGTGTWTVPQLPLTSDGQPEAYLAPNATSANLCTCSAASYNLMSACAACQGGAWLLFAPWALTCESAGFLTLPADFPANIPVPSNTTIPQYAATDPRAWFGAGFNVTQAHQIALGGPSPAFTSSATTPEHSATETSSTTPSNSPQPASRQDNTGAIVGGVVGGILGSALVAVILVWLLCAQSIRKRFKRNSTEPRGDIMGRTFGTPAGPPPLANIVVPIPVRPYPVRNGIDSYMSSTSAGSNTGDYPGSATGHKEMTGSDGLARSDVGIMELGSSQNHRPLTRNSSFAASLIQRVSSSMRWRRRTQTNSMGSIGTGTVMTTTVTGMDSDTGYGSRHVSRQNTARGPADPTPFILPSHPEETTVVDISPEGVDHTSPYGMSAAEEKRRLNPPGFPGSGPWTNRNSRSQNSDPGEPNSLLDISSGATAGSESRHVVFAPVPPSTITPGTAIGRASLPSNIVLPSPFDLLSQDASSGVLDSSPIHVRPAAADLKFAVVNPSRDVEM